MKKRRNKVELRPQAELEQRLSAEDLRGAPKTSAEAEATGFSVWSATGFSVWSATGFSVWSATGFSVW